MGEPPVVHLDHVEHHCVKCILPYLPVV